MLDRNINNRRVYRIKLSMLKNCYDKKDDHILSYLLACHAIYIDSKFCLKLRTGQILMEISTIMLDFQLTVAN